MQGLLLELHWLTVIDGGTRNHFAGVTASDDNDYGTYYWGSISWSDPCRSWRIWERTEDLCPVLGIRRYGQVKGSALQHPHLTNGENYSSSYCLTGWGQSDWMSVKVLVSLKALCKYNQCFQNHHFLPWQSILSGLIMPSTSSSLLIC